MKISVDGNRGKKPNSVDRLNKGDFKIDGVSE